MSDRVTFLIQNNEILELICKRLGDHDSDSNIPRSSICEV